MQTDDEQWTRNTCQLASPPVCPMKNVRLYSQAPDRGPAYFSIITQSILMTLSLWLKMQ